MRKPNGQFSKGEHWRTAKPFWKKGWLHTEYVVKKRSAGDIARDFAMKEAGIRFWLNKHGIPARTISEARKVKKWTVTGNANGMFGKRGDKSPTWKGGLTPARQRIYARAEWRAAVRAVLKRDKACRKCGSTGKFHIHHIDPFASAPLLATDIGNLIRLCVPCHGAIKGKEGRYKRELFSLIK